METTIFDNNGVATAYIADDGNDTIYLWTGEAAAYLEMDAVYGWNGKHLGWFDDGKMYDLNGNRIGSVKEKSNILAQQEPLKMKKQLKRKKFKQQIKLVKNVLKLGNPDINLRDYLWNGYE